MSSARGDLRGRLGQEVQLALGDPHRRLEVAAGLVQPAQDRVGVEIGRRQLGHHLLELLARIVGGAQPIGQHRRALAGRGGGLGQIVDGVDLGVHRQQVGQLAVARGAAVQPGQRLERGAVARRHLAQPLPGLDRALAVAELVVDHQRVAHQVAGAQRRGGRAGLGRRRRRRVAHQVQPLEDRRQLAPALRRLVEIGDRGQRVLVGGRRLERLLPALERARVVAVVGRHPRQPAQDLGPLGGAGRRGRVVLERLGQALLVAGLLEGARHPIERVAIAGQDLEHARRRVDHAVDVAQPGLAHRRQLAQRGQPLDALADRPLAGGAGVAAEPPRVELELPAQRAGQAGVVALALVHLDQRLERAVVVGAQLEDLLVQRDRPPRLDLALAVGVGDPPQRVGALAAGGRRRRLALEHRHQLLPHLGARRQPPHRLLGLGAAGLELLDAAPRVERARHVAQPQLADLRDLLEAPHQLAERRAGLAGVVERELVQVAQPAEVAALAEVLDVAGQRVVVLRVERQRVVQELGGAILVAQVIAGELRQLEQLAHLGLGVVGVGGQLALVQRGQLGPPLILAQQRAQPGRRRAAGRLERGQLGQRRDELSAIRTLAIVERDPLGQQARALAVVAGVAGQPGPLGQQPVELIPPLGGAQRGLERGGRAGVVRVGADRPAQERDRRRRIAGRRGGAPQLHVQFAGPARADRRVVRGRGPRRRPVDLGQRLARRGRLAVEPHRLVARRRRRLAVAAAQLDLAERQPQLGAPQRRRLVAQHVELGAVQLGHHRVVAERRVQAARRGQRVGALRLESPRRLPVRQRAIDAAEVLIPQAGRDAVARRAPRGAGAIGLGLGRGGVGALGQLVELGLEDVAGLGGAPAGEQHLDQAQGRLFVAGIERAGGAQIALRQRRVAEHRARLAGLGPQIGGLGRGRLERRAQLAHFGQKLALPAGAQRLPQRREARAVARVLAEPVEVRGRDRRRPRRRVVLALGHPGRSRAARRRYHDASAAGGAGAGRFRRGSAGRRSTRARQAPPPSPSCDRGACRRGCARGRRAARAPGPRAPAAAARNR
jgi:hypothetical protein